MTNEERLANSNSKALIAIFKALDTNQFKLISTCNSAKKAWEILQKAHEGHDNVCLSRLQFFTTKFENVRMHEEETISEFKARLHDIANEAIEIGENVFEEKLVWKALRFLLKRFAYKTTTIEEAKDVRNMRLEELMGSLETFEMRIEEEKAKRKNKRIA